MERRVRGNSYARCEWGEKAEIMSKPYLSIQYEFAWNLGISIDMSRKELAAALGSPTEIRRNTWFYRTDEGQYVYFTYRNGKMTWSGLCEQIF